MLVAREFGHPTEAFKLHREVRGPCWRSVSVIWSRRKYTHISTRIKQVFNISVIAPAIRAPALPRPSAHGHPGAATRRREMHARLSQLKPECVRRLGTCCPCAGQIRASSVHAYRSLAGIPVRYASVDTAI
jgi:hypothetical protein